VKKNSELTSYTSSCIITKAFSSKKPIEWLGSSFKDLMGLPTGIRRVFGFALYLAQIGGNMHQPKSYRDLVDQGT